jgi:hypothetical protein
VLGALTFLGNLRDEGHVLLLTNAPFGVCAALAASCCEIEAEAPYDSGSIPKAGQACMAWSDKMDGGLNFCGYRGIFSSNVFVDLPRIYELGSMSRSAIARLYVVRAAVSCKVI